MKNPHTSQPLWTGRWSDVYQFAKTVPGGEPIDFVPVRIAIRGPRFWPAAKKFPYLAALAPQGELFKISDRRKFTKAYRARLDEFGYEHIYTLLEGLIDKYGRPLVLLCYEDVSDGTNWCHRQVFAEWWTDQTGQIVLEAPGFTAETLASVSA